MPAKHVVHVAKNGRHYVRLPNGQTQFITKDEAKKLIEAEVLEPRHHHHRRRSSTSSASVSVRGHAEIDFNERQLGHVLRGFVEAARGDGGRGDVDRMFGEAPSPSHEEALLLDLGRELFGHMPAALTYFDVVSDEWSSWFRRSPSTRPGVMPATSTPSFVPPVSPLAWLAPVVGRITQRFGQGHSGIDIACPVGTPVVAPVDLRVTKVGFDATAGHFVVADAMRDDGTFKGDGYRVTFAHLSDVDVAQGQTVRRGQVVAQSGATGNATGPHLHFRVEWIDDGLFRDKALAVDPLALIPEAVLSGAAQPQPISGGSTTAMTADGQPINVIVAPGAGRVSIGHGIIQPDTNVRVQSPDAQFQSFIVPKGDDPLAGIVTDVENVIHTITKPVGDVINAVASPDVLKTIGGLVSTGAGLVGALQPETLPVAAPVAGAGVVVASNAQPISNAIKEVSNPLEGII
jgi:hypothetical protein